MSRTIKDKKWSLRYPENDYQFGTDFVPYCGTHKHWKSGEEIEITRYWCRNIPGAKRRKSGKNTENGCGFRQHLLGGPE